MRQHWRELDYWVWLWRERLPGLAKAAVAALVFAAVLIGGWFAADSLTAAKAGTSTDALVFETTVNKLITVREKGKLVTKVVPVVKRVVRVRSSTRTQFQRETDVKYSTRLVTKPGHVRTVRRVVTTRVPVVTTKVVRRNGKTRTVRVTTFVPTTRTETQVETQTRTETRQQTVTQPGAQNTVTQATTVNRTTTDIRTQTQTTTQVVTTTQTVTEVNTVTDTVTNTVTDVQTVTEPPVTVTVTITEPALP